MNLLHFQGNPVWVNNVVLILSGVLVGFAGSRLERYADRIAGKMKGRSVLIGMVLLSFATSLPEIVTSLTAIALGNIELAVHNLLGSIVVVTAILAISDSFSKGPLTYFTPEFSLLMEGVGLIILLSMTIIGFMTGGAVVSFPFDIKFDLWGLALVAGYAATVVLTKKSEQSPQWRPMNIPQADEKQDEKPPAEQQKPLKALLIIFAFFSFLVLIGGFFVTQSANAISAQTRLSSGFIGATLVSFTTSLPEMSTVFSASKSRHFRLAMANIFGSNLVVLVLLGMISFLGGGLSVFSYGKDSVIFVSAAGILVTGIYLWGLLERQNRSFLRLGWDSFLILIISLGVMCVLYYMK